MALGLADSRSVTGGRDGRLIGRRRGGGRRRWPAGDDDTGLVDACETSS